MAVLKDKRLGEHPNCGGAVRISDLGTHNQWRYEVHCEKCLECDPNGYGSFKEARVKGKEYFGITNPKSESEK